MGQGDSSVKMICLRGMPFALWLAAILYLSLTSKPPCIPIDLLAWDKFQHASAYALLTVLGGPVFAVALGSTRRGWIASCVFAVTLGAVLEVGQAWLTRSRYGDLADLAADALGALLVLAMALGKRFFHAHGKEK